MTVLGREASPSSLRSSKGGISALAGIPKLPLVFAGVGAAYYLATLAQKPMTPDPAWDRHMHDARFGLFAGLGAGAILWWFEQ